MKKSSRIRRYAIIAAALLLLFTLVVFFVLPPLLKSQLEQRLSATLGRRVTVAKIRLNPYTLSLTLENFLVHERDGAAPFVGWRRLYVNVDGLGSLWREWAVSEIELVGFDARVALNADQSFNFSDLLAKFAAPSNAPAPTTPAKPPRPIRIASLKVDHARVAFSDHSRPAPFATTLGPLTFALTGFRTVSERGAPYQFQATTEAGERLAWSGALSAEPLRSTGELRLENIVLRKYAPYYASQLQADLTSGQLSLRGRYELDLTKSAPVMKLLDGAVQLRAIKLVERATQELALDLPVLDISGIQADALTLKAAIASVTLRAGQLRARREKDGTINLLAMLQPPPSTVVPAAPSSSATSTPASSIPTAATPAAPAKLPEVTLAELAIHDCQLALTDLAAPRPAQLALADIQLSLRDVTLAQGAKMPLQLSFDWAPRGSVKLEGTVGLSPLTADLRTTVSAFEILPLSPYLEAFVNARFTQGTLAATLNTQAALPAGQPPVATVTGNLALENLGLVDTAQNWDLAGFTALHLRGLQATTAPELSVTLDELAVDAPYARVIVNPDRTLNLATLPRTPATPATSAPSAVALPTAAAAPTASPTSAAPALPLKLTINRIAVRDGDYRFTDRSITPNVSIALNRFGGTITGLSSANLAKADVDLKATVDGAGPIAITGKLDALGPKPFVDLKLDFKNVDLLPLSAYSGKYAGYELARGKLLLDMKVLVDGPKINASNVLTLQQFTFGNPVQSPDATKLPVRLGVALLKDLDGKIVIDVPVQGSTDDPSFSIGRVVLRVIVNLLAKAATSPFTLLGAAFGGGEELAFQEFAPGSSELQPTELKKLQTMVQALTNRPGLNLDLRGGYDEAADTYALKRTKLADQVRRAIWEEKRRADPNLPPPDQLAITPDEHAATIKKLYDEKFPPGTQFGTPLPSAPAPVAPPQPPAGWFKRIVRAVTFEERREARVVQAENARLAAEHDQAVAAARAKGLPLDEMTGRLAEAVVVEPEDLRTLAQARAQRVRTYFTDTGKIAPDRLFLAKESGTSAPQPTGPRVLLTLQ